MNVLFTSVGLGTLEAETYIAEWTACHQIVEQMPMDRIAGYLRLNPASALALIDVIVCMADSNMIVPAFPVYPQIDFPVEKALRLAEEISNLPDQCTTYDGRKWKKIPFAIFGSEEASTMWSQEHKGGNARVFSVDSAFTALKKVEELVDEYQKKLLNDYQNLGLLVRVENGRSQINSALKLKTSESEFYYAAGDRRIHNGWVTIKRDREGLRADIELFAMLLDRRASETEMHKFFEEHPAILMEARMGIPISHRPRFLQPKNDKPDFSFAPILGPLDKKSIEVMELKGPAEKTLKAMRFHPGFSTRVHSAVDQVKDYDRYLRDPANAAAVLQAFGYLPDASKLAVLIGRDPKGDAEREIWAQRQSELNVTIVTYDEIFTKQAAQLQDSHPYTIISSTTEFPRSKKIIARLRPNEAESK